MLAAVVGKLGGGKMYYFGGHLAWKRCLKAWWVQRCGLRSSE